MLLNDQGVSVAAGVPDGITLSTQRTGFPTQSVPFLLCFFSLIEVRVSVREESRRGRLPQNEVVYSKLL